MSKILYVSVATLALAAQLVVAQPLNRRTFGPKPSQQSSSSVVTNNNTNNNNNSNNVMMMMPGGMVYGTNMGNPYSSSSSTSTTETFGTGMKPQSHTTSRYTGSGNGMNGMQGGMYPNQHQGMQMGGNMMPSNQAYGNKYNAKSRGMNMPMGGDMSQSMEAPMSTPMRSPMDTPMRIPMATPNVNSQPISVVSNVTVPGKDGKPSTFQYNYKGDVANQGQNNENQNVGENYSNQGSTGSQYPKKSNLKYPSYTNMNNQAKSQKAVNNSQNIQTQIAPSQAPMASNEPQVENQVQETTAEETNTESNENSSIDDDVNQVLDSFTKFQESNQVPSSEIESASSPVAESQPITEAVPESQPITDTIPESQTKPSIEASIPTPQSQSIEPKAKSQKGTYSKVPPKYEAPSYPEGANTKEALLEDPHAHPMDNMEVPVAPAPVVSDEIETQLSLPGLPPPGSA